MRLFALLVFALLVLVAVPSGLAEAAGWDRVQWGMKSSEIAAIYGNQAKRLTGRIEFVDAYADVVLTRAPFAGHDFTVYFQMDTQTERLKRVLLERRRQYASPTIFRDVLSTLESNLGKPLKRCDRKGAPMQGKATVLTRVWSADGSTVRASFLDFTAPVLDDNAENYLARQRFEGNLLGYRNLGMSRRLLIRYSPAEADPPECD